MNEQGDWSELKAAARSLYADKIAADVVHALAGGGIPAILLKGPAIADLIQEPSRNYVDCDILVPASRFEDAERILASLDLSLVAMDVFKHDWLRHAHTWVRADGAEVDLHKTLIGAGVQPDQVWTVLDQETEPMEIGGRELRVLNPPARALALVLHAAKDGTRVGRPIQDLEQALKILPQQVWEGAAGIAERLHASPGLAAGLRLVAEGADLADRLHLTRSVPTEILLRTAGAPQLALGVDHFFKQRSLRTRLGLLVSKAFPPLAFIRAWSPVARRGTIGLIAAYSWRPVWLLLHIGPAVAAWRRAQTQARSVGGQERIRAKRDEIGRDPIPSAVKVRIVFRIAIAFVSVHWSLRRRGLPETVAALGTGRSVYYRVDARRLGRIIHRVLSVGDRRARCLINSLVALKLLKEQGNDPELVIGLPESPEGVFAHAWIELDGEDVGPPPGRGRHEELIRYG
jgi:hypothetical protein